MILHDLTLGMHPRRVRIFIAEKGIEIRRREVDVIRKANGLPEFLKLNPLGKLPVLQLDDGFAVSESLTICRFLEDLHPNPSLFGRALRETAVIDMWIRRMEHELSRPIMEVFRHTSEFYSGRIEQILEVARYGRDHALSTMHWLDSELAGRKYIADNIYSMADIVAQCAFVLGKAIGLRIPPELTHLSRWFDTVSARPTARA